MTTLRWTMTMKDLRKIGTIFFANMRSWNSRLQRPLLAVFGSPAHYSLDYYYKSRVTQTNEIIGCTLDIKACIRWKMILTYF